MIRCEATGAEHIGHLRWRAMSAMLMAPSCGSPLGLRIVTAAGTSPAASTTEGAL